MNKHTETPAWILVADLAERGKTCNEITRELGLTTVAVRQLASYARRRGRSVKLHKASESTFIKNALRNRNSGKVGNVLRGLPREVITWVTGQIPEGGSLADVVRAMVIDAYYDEVSLSSAKPD